MQINNTLAYKIDDFAEASGMGRTSIFAAIKAGELKTIRPIIAGKPSKRRLITPEEGRRWIASFPPSEKA